MNQQLVIWPERDRAIPNCVARSALFNVERIRAGGERPYLRNIEVASLGKPVTIHYTGEQLRQDDMDVWLQLVHMRRDQLDQPLDFTCYAMFKALGWSDRAGNRDRLFAIIKRLNGAQVVVTYNNGNEVYGSVLVYSFKSNIRDRTWRVGLNLELADLFMPTGYTRIEWEVRKQLPPIGKWLQYHFMSHQVQYPVRFESLRFLSGSQAKPKEWRRQVLDLLPELVKHSVLKSFEILPDGWVWPKR